MADKTSMAKYETTGFAKASGVDSFKTEAAKLNTDSTALKQQAEAQYKPTYEAEQNSLNTQLTALIKSQTDDSELLNKQYQQSVNTMMEKIKARGLATGTLPQVQTDALKKFHNEVMDQRQAVYNVQRSGIQNVQKTLRDNYDLNIQARMDQNRDNTLQSLTNVLTQIAELQSKSFQDYIKYLLAKNKKKSGGGGYGRRYRRYGGGSSGSSAETPSGGLPADYYSETKSGPTRPAGEAFTTQTRALNNALGSKVHRVN